MNSINKKILLKISGEALSATTNGVYAPLDNKKVLEVAKELAEICKDGYKIGIVIGGGNIMRGGRSSLECIPRHVKDTIGLYATYQNALAISGALEMLNFKTKVFTTIPTAEEYYTVKNAISCLEKGYINIYACGTGHGYCTTDTAATLRAAETGATLYKATTVDGVYDKDPKLNDAKWLDSITYEEYLRLGLKVMDKTAIAIAEEAGIPIVVFKGTDEDIKNIKRILNNEGKFSTIHN